MKTSTNIRVKTDPRYETLYRDLKLVCEDFHAIFFLCVCLGYRAKRRKSAAARRAERFWSATITLDEWTAYYSIALIEEEEDLAVLGDDAHVIAVAEAYADGGMEVLLEELLGPYLTGGEVLSLEKNASKALANELLKFLWDKEAEASQVGRCSPSPESLLPGGSTSSL